jgi:ABC-type multidrug transport system fused ATPase/permease subunit
MPRFYDAMEGRVLLDGVDVRDLKLDSLRSQFSIVLQEPLLFADSIKENIRYGKPDASDDEVWEAAAAARAHTFITSLPDGYRTKLGERGAKVSGGERQRLAVARAILRDAPILILDEPTSSVDSQTETEIFDALRARAHRRTTIIIAHRLSTLRDVDRLLVVDGGRIVQEGTHDELVECDGMYRTLWETQTRVRRRHLKTTPDANATRTTENPRGAWRRDEHGWEWRRDSARDD